MAIASPLKIIIGLILLVAVGITGYLLIQGRNITDGSTIDASDPAVKRLKKMCNTGGAVRAYGITIRKDNIVLECSCRGKQIRVNDPRPDASWEGCLGEVINKCYKLPDQFSLDAYFTDKTYFRQYEQVSCTP